MHSSWVCTPQRHFLTLAFVTMLESNIELLVNARSGQQLISAQLTALTYPATFGLQITDANNDKKSMIKNTFFSRFPAHGEPGTCRPSVVSAEQPVLCIPIRPIK